MKNLRTIREDLKEAVTHTEPGEEAADLTGSLLSALNHLTSIADDLYAAIGDEDVEIDEDEADSILIAYDTLYEIHKKYDAISPMASSLDYDLDDQEIEIFDKDVFEELALQKEELAIIEGVKLSSILSSMGMKKMQPGANTFTDKKNTIKSLYGLPMRAGKAADVWFVQYDDSYSFVDSDKTTDFTDESKAVDFLQSKMKKEDTLQEERDFAGFSDKNLLKWIKDNVKSSSAKDDIQRAKDEVKKRGLDESTEDLLETPGGPSKLQQLKASLAGFEKKLASGKFPDSADDFKKMIAKIKDQIKTYSVKKEDIDEAAKSFKFNKDKHEIIVSDKRINGKFSITVVDKATNNKVFAKMTDELTDAQEGKTKEDEASRVLAAKRLLAKSMNEKFVLGYDISEQNDLPYRALCCNIDMNKMYHIIESTDVHVDNYLVLDENILCFESAEDRDIVLESVANYAALIEENTAVLQTEAFDAAKFRRLAITGLVADNDIGQIIQAMKNLDSGKTLTSQQKDLISSTFVSLVGLVTGDTATFTKISSSIKKQGNDAV